ncbi:MAG: hypothetical protein P8Z31_06580 [Gammaproteobacteria bacterium]
MRFRTGAILCVAMITAMLAVTGQAGELAQAAGQADANHPAIEPVPAPSPASPPGARPAAPIESAPPPAASPGTAAPEAAQADALALMLTPADLPAEPVDNSAFPLLEYVPKNTLYLFTASRPLPEAFINGQLQMAADFFGQFMSLAQRERTAKKQPPRGTVDAFTFELMKEITKSLQPETLADLGLSMESRGVFYAYGLLPVFRVELGDEEKFRGMIARVEKRSGYSLRWEKCGTLDCLNLRDPAEPGNGVLLVLHPDHLALGIYIGEPAWMAAHLTGEKRVAAPYSHASLQKFIADNGYTGHGEGFVRLRAAVDVVEPVVAAMLTRQEREAEIAQVKNCMAVARDVLDQVPEIIIGTRSVDEKSFHSELLLRTSPELAGIMKTLPASLGKMPVSQKPLLDVGIGMNIPAVRDNLLGLLTWLGEQGERRGCAAIDARKLGEASVGIAMATVMGLTQVQAVYLALDDMAFDEASRQPVRLDARASIVADDPAGLVRLASIMAPPLAQIRMPQDGETITLGPDVLPPGTPPLDIGLEGKRLDIRTAGNDGPTGRLPEEPAALFRSSIDGPRYYRLVGELAKMSPQSSGDPDAALGIELIEAMARIQPSTTHTIYPDDRGLVFDLQVSYPDAVTEKTAAGAPVQ